MELLQKYQVELNKACINAQVDELYAFGSILTEHFNDESDIDFIVSIHSRNPIEYGENYFQLKFDLEKIFKRKIDLLEQKAIRNELFKELVNKTKKLIYAGRGKSVA